MVEVGYRFGKLTVVECVGLRGGSWRCKCDCGSEVTVLTTRLINKRRTSCGCGRTPRTNLTDQEALWGRYQSMKTRCTYEAAPNYPNYGGRGIKVCDRWQSFKLFCEDVGMPPSPEHQLDRIDCDGDYEPGNCRWVTRKEQNRNRRNNRWITYKGDTRTLREWAQELGVSDGTLHDRLAKMTVEEVFAYKPRKASKK